ncbi:cupin domain-containing protein [Candidatus Latescibacterota bacterium]
MRYVVLMVMAILVSTVVWSQKPASVISQQEYRSFVNSRDPIIYFSGRRNPDIDTNVDYFIRKWEESIGHIGHGGFVEHPYFTQGNPAKPDKPGAILSFLKEYNHGILGPNSVTQPVKHDKEQEFFFVLSGTGKVEAGGKTISLKEGTGVFIPAGLTYQFKNPSETPLEVVIVVEETGEGFEPGTEMISGNYHDSRASYGGHWCHVVRRILRGAKYYNPLSFIVVSIESFDIAHPHAHVEGSEEIWNQIRGESLLFVGKQLRRQPVGTAFMAPPDSSSAHTSINHTGEPMYWFYCSIRYDQKPRAK